MSNNIDKEKIIQEYLTELEHCPEYTPVRFHEAKKYGLSVQELEQILTGEFRQECLFLVCGNVNIVNLVAGVMQNNGDRPAFHGVHRFLDVTTEREIWMRDGKNFRENGEAQRVARMGNEEVRYFYENDSSPSADPLFIDYYRDGILMYRIHYSDGVMDTIIVHDPNTAYTCRIWKLERSILPLKTFRARDEDDDTRALAIRFRGRSLLPDFLRRSGRIISKSKQ